MSSDNPVAKHLQSRFNPDDFVVTLVLLNATLGIAGMIEVLPKGWAVLADIAITATALGCLLLWFAFSVVFGRRYQFGLRTLLLLFVVVAIPCAWFRSASASAKRQRNAVEAVDQLWGGHVTYDFDADDDGLPRYGPVPSVQRTWFFRLFGVDFFADVVGVAVGEHEHDSYVGSVVSRHPGKPVKTDRDLDFLSDFAYLRCLQIIESDAITDAALDKVPDFRRLRWLDLSCTKLSETALNHPGLGKELRTLIVDSTDISDAGLDVIKRIPKLVCLTLRDTRITDAAGERLEGLTRLKVLCLNGTRFGDRGLMHLAPLQQLEELDLENTRVGDAGLQALRNMNALTKLNLRGTRMTDAGMQYLSGLRRITRLDLSHTRISDAGLRYLKDLGDVRWLYLRETDIAGPGLAYLTGLHKLAGIDLIGTRIGDDSLENIKKMSNLEWAGLLSTHFSQAAENKLHEALPKCDNRFLPELILEPAPKRSNEN